MSIHVSSTGHRKFDVVFNDTSNFYGAVGLNEIFLRLESNFCVTTKDTIN